MPSTLKIDYQKDSQRAVLECTNEELSGQWNAIRRLCEERGTDVIFLGPRTLTLPWWSLLSFRDGLIHILQTQKVSLSATPEATEQLSIALERQKSLEAADEVRPALNQDELQIALQKIGFLRNLMPYQARNIARLIRFTAGATFSVPGSGKTTEALAYYFITRNPEDRLLVIAPKNAFMAWEEELRRCIPEAGFEFVRLTGGRARIQELLRGRPNAAIITYQQLPRVVDLLAEYLLQIPCYLFLDESHRMKRGIQGVQGTSVLQISHLPKKKLIMSGTPMPNNVVDLVPQFTFLYPEIYVDSDTVVNRLQPIYVRTTKQELGLDDPIRVIHEVPMSLGQQRLYEALSSDTARRAEGLNINDRSRLRAFARSVQHMLQAASNPALLINSELFNHPLLRDALEDGLSPKLIETCRIARELATKNQKVIIWSYFINTVLHITALLEDIGAEPIYGAISTSEDEELTDTREAKIRRFHNDPSCMVLVANPAACAEGISLHEVCHNAIYIDRNYNAAQYLQSEDRIHRIGIPPGTKTYVTILQSPTTLDISVDRRLRVKVESMSRVLSDPSLNINPLDLDETSLDVLDEDDLADLKELLRGA